MVYTETKPRGPIFIDFTGPGPAYSLPSLVGTNNHDTRSNYSKAPSYSIAGRWRERKASDCPPGPIYNPRTSWVNESGGVSLKGRHRPRSPESSGPGPGAYRPNFSWLSENRASPAYSVGGRHGGRGPRDDTPGPNAYAPSFAPGEGRGFSLKGRPRAPTTGGGDTPGPLQYKPGSGVVRYGRTTGPEVSLKGRGGPVAERETVGPGPAAYEPRLDALSSSRSLPAWSLSSRHRPPGAKDPTPGPQTYRPHPAANSAPAYSLQGKRRVTTGADHSPGPALYNPDPAVGVRGRCERKAASLKGRPRDRKKDSSPGPGAYDAGSPRDNGPSYTMAGKWRKRQNEALTPGPNKYFPSVLEEGPAYSLKGRHKENEKPDAGPGPAAYNTDKVLDPGPAYSISGKWMTDDITATGDNSPGPGAYYPQQPLVKEDKGISFGVRHSRAKLEPAAIQKSKRTVI